MRVLYAGYRAIDLWRAYCRGARQDSASAMSQSVESFASRAIRILGEVASDEATALGPFFARVLLENSCAALVGRLDPFRILYLSEFQGQPEYEHGKRARSGFSWFGDVMPAEERNSELWNLEQDVSKIGRALFSKHIDHVCWQPAVESMLDFVSAHGSDPLLRDILSLGAETYVKKTKGQSQQLYSTLSKGVHWEFFNSALLFDEATVKSAIRETCLLVAHLGLVSHFNLGVQSI
ncbi:hypothetical protein MTR72_12710 [Bradyrhizobium sp. ISRA442]|uniref:hypothetical protein n=1 Tax=Bradyrhizobium sp. ISRA442 TaxID=2866197 RepID=UPI00311B2512